MVVTLKVDDKTNRKGKLNTSLLIPAQMLIKCALGVVIKTILSRYVAGVSRTKLVAFFMLGFN